MIRRIRTTASLAAIALLAAACADVPVEYSYPTSGPGGKPTYEKKESLVGPDGLDLFQLGRAGQTPTGGGGVAVNAFLWRASLDTLSFMPLSSADPFGGVIITDWYTPQASAGERFKASAYILTKDLRSDGVKVTIFRQVPQGNHWVDAPVSQVTVSEIENKVLDRARRLREQMQAST